MWHFYKELRLWMSNIKIKIKSLKCTTVRWVLKLLNWKSTINKNCSIKYDGKPSCTTIQHTNWSCKFLSCSLFSSVSKSFTDSIGNFKSESIVSVSMSNWIGTYTFFVCKTCIILSSLTCIVLNRCSTFSWSKIGYNVLEIYFEYTCIGHIPMTTKLSPYL